LSIHRPIHAQHTTDTLFLPSQNYTLDVGETKHVRANIKVSSTETGVIFGNIVYESSGSDRNVVVLNDIHIDIMDYIAPATCHGASCLSCFFFSSRLVFFQPFFVYRTGRSTAVCVNSPTPPSEHPRFDQPYTHYVHTSVNTISFPFPFPVLRTTRHAVPRDVGGV
jgi:hypothetical protein